MSTLAFDVRTRGDLKNDVFPIIAPVPTAGSKGMNLKFEIQPATNPTSEKERAARLVDPGFGRIFTDHMAVVRYNQAKGWHGARVEARAIRPQPSCTTRRRFSKASRPTSATTAA